MHLGERQKKHLRGLAHGLKPVILIGHGGVSANLLAELDAALNHHELIKVKLRVGDRDRRDAAIREAAAQAGALVVNQIGNTAVLYRPRPDNPRIILP